MKSAVLIALCFHEIILADHRLKRDIHPMQKFIHEALKENVLIDSYKNRPPFQQNDYIGWITRAKRDETRIKRSNQMMDELENGDIYMKMEWKP